MKNYYSVLGLKQGASIKEIKDAFRRMSKKYHPDVCREKDAKEKMQEVLEAYEHLYKNKGTVNNTNEPLEIRIINSMERKLRTQYNGQQIKDVYYYLCMNIINNFDFDDSLIIVKDLYQKNNTDLLVDKKSRDFSFNNIAYNFYETIVNYCIDNNYDKNSKNLLLYNILMTLLNKIDYESKIEFIKDRYSFYTNIDKLFKFTPQEDDKKRTHKKVVL